jgi:hypothetical protein
MCFNLFSPKVSARLLKAMPNAPKLTKIPALLPAGWE